MANVDIQHKYENNELHTQKSVVGTASFEYDNLYTDPHIIGSLKRGTLLVAGAVMLTGMAVAEDIDISVQVNTVDGDTLVNNLVTLTDSERVKKLSDIDLANDTPILIEKDCVLRVICIAGTTENKMGNVKVAIDFIELNDVNGDRVPTNYLP